MSQLIDDAVVAIEAYIKKSKTGIDDAVEVNELVNANSAIKSLENFSNEVDMKDYRLELLEQAMPVILELYETLGNERYTSKYASLTSLINE